MPGLEVALGRGACEAVPRADNLAVVATEHPIADQWSQFFRDRRLQFDGQVGNTTPRIQHIRPDKGSRRADVHACRATSAMFGGMWGIHGQWQVEKQFAEKEETARLAVEHQGVLADPA